MKTRVNYTNLTSANGGTISTPIYLPLAIDLGTMTATNIGSGTLLIDGAFLFCTSLTSVSFPAVISIGAGTFINCTSLINADLPLAETIGDNAFMWCESLVSVFFPVVTRVGKMAFRGCISLTNINIPAVTDIGNYAFSVTGDMPLTVTLRETTPPSLGANIFGRYFVSDAVPAKTVTVKVPVGAAGYGVSPTNTYDSNWGNGFRGGGWISDYGYIPYTVTQTAITVIIEHE
ncbi:MAG: leucine-rich repeat domain-containing protein [Treponema sp.]|nr:leucine-rich repeat domain-containing protein [Treponema sp.]